MSMASENKAKQQDVRELTLHSGESSAVAASESEDIVKGALAWADRSEREVEVLLERRCGGFSYLDNESTLGCREEERFEPRLSTLPLFSMFLLLQVFGRAAVPFLLDLLKFCQKSCSVVIITVLLRVLILIILETTKQHWADQAVETRPASVRHNSYVLSTAKKFEPTWCAILELESTPSQYF
ncbi:hypothetical protein EYF80_001012 [Liparis tanakae]|uniref:Uncharacterized protein n=1 Tax=Liparis tanakae TaxID=230148 RepID=A0A4Z2JES7_9TELE|nr:hypothetical protein EYF80_001012 [Liparis tanakae]